VFGACAGCCGVVLFGLRDLTCNFGTQTTSTLFHFFRTFKTHFDLRTNYFHHNGNNEKKQIRNIAPKSNLLTSLNLGIPVGEKLVCALYFLDWIIRSKVMDDSNVHFARF
jgi:hypothetical protein